MPLGRLLGVGLGVLCVLLPALAWADPPPDPEDPGGSACAWYELFCHLREFAVWLLCWIAGHLAAIGLWALSSLPSSWAPGVNGAAYWLQRANTWVDVGYGFRLFGYWVAVALTLYFLRTARRFIPFLN